MATIISVIRVAMEERRERKALVKKAWRERRDFDNKHLPNGARLSTKIKAW